MMMIDRLFILLTIGIVSTVFLFSEDPQPSRLPVTSEDYDDVISKMKEKRTDEIKEKKKQRESLKKKIEFSYLAHQKNYLASFTDQDGFIWFYDEGNKYTYFLGNFYPCSMHMWDMKFSCSEAAFQAAKFAHRPEIAVRFTHLDGEGAWKLARKLSYIQRPDWYQVRESVMLEVIRAKFKQNRELAELLQSTGDSYLVEHTSRDAFWADGGDGTGKNRLGYLLMQLRGESGGVGTVDKPKKYKKFISHKI
jgi:ribA/ribD-fused uncharacterized protein